MPGYSLCRWLRPIVVCLDAYLASSTIIDASHFAIQSIQAAPDHASRAQQREFQTTMLSVLMEHLLAADVLLGEQAALPLASTNSYATIALSVFYFASRLVDKLWHGQL